MKSIHTLALTALAAAMAAGSAFAQQPTTPRTTQSQLEQTQQTTRTEQQARQREQSQVGARDYGRDHDKGDDKPSYGEINTRGDDRVTRADLSAHPRLLEHFDDIDGDGDGAISRSEYETWKSEKMDKPSYRELNVRGDGRVTRADLSAHPRLMEKFDEMDSDGDGTLSRSEYEAWKSDKDSKDHDERRSEY